jgi:hypothetical protein
MTPVELYKVILFLRYKADRTSNRWCTWTEELRAIDPFLDRQDMFDKFWEINCQYRSAQWREAITNLGYNDKFPENRWAGYEIGVV